MKKLKLLVIVYMGLAFTACSSIAERKSVDTVSHCKHKSYSLLELPRAQKKDPLAVSLYSKGTQLHHPYQVIGLETVSKYNHVGIKRQEANIRDTMRIIAAAMGGDAVIDLKYEKQMVTGTVVSYKKKATQEMA